MGPPNPCPPHIKWGTNQYLAQMAWLAPMGYKDWKTPREPPLPPPFITGKHHIIYK
uniref:Uncharacterized protein n=1 Tax=Cucumis melo TaxID=3656 RepID=A0A9I9D738_CUCME